MTYRQRLFASRRFAWRFSAQTIITSDNGMNKSTAAPLSPVAYMTSNTGEAMAYMKPNQAEGGGVDYEWTD
jgi:hypothetical protein